jgi:SAM-dependent methyltransferase
MEDLPYADKSFDLVTGFNSFEFAADPLSALQEARRVARVGALVVMATWGRRQNCPAAAYVAVLGSLMPTAPLGTPDLFALSENGALQALVKQVGLMPVYMADVDCVWDYPNLETALRALLSAGPAVKAIQATGEQRAVEAVTEAITPFKQPSGDYRLANQFRYVIAMRPQ